MITGVFLFSSLFLYKLTQKTIPDSVGKLSLVVKWRKKMALEYYIVHLSNHLNPILRSGALDVHFNCTKLCFLPRISYPVMNTIPKIGMYFNADERLCRVTT